MSSAPHRLQVLPRGAGLPEDRWRARHRGIVWLLWLHAAAITGYALVQGASLLHSIIEGSAVALFAALATLRYTTRLVRTLAAAAGLLTSSAALVHLSGGLIEMHFHFFVMVAVVAMYQDWIPFLLSILYVLVHHGIAGAVDPGSVFNHSAAIAAPWKWAGIHALFIAGISVALLTYWRLNEGYLAAQHRAERRAHRKARVISMVNDIGQSLTGELDETAIVQKVIVAATELTPATSATFVFGPDHRQGVKHHPATPTTVSSNGREPFPLPRHSDLWDATLRGGSIVRLDDARADPRSGKDLALEDPPAIRSYLGVPVVFRGTVLGGLFLAHPRSGMFTEDDERLVGGIAAHAAAAFGAASLFQSERTARERAGILVEASRALGASLELGPMMQELGHLVVPLLADAFVADILDDRGQLVRVAQVVDGEIAAAKAIPLAPPPTREAVRHPIVRAIQFGITEVVDSGCDDLLIGSAAVTDNDRTLGQADPLSAVIAPLMVRNQPVGAFTLVSTSKTRRLDSDDKALIEELALLAASAVENAKHYERQRSTAEVLQHALLPPDLPELPGVSAAARYKVGGPGVEVGGDWYDAMTLHDGSLALVMGDVVGRGVPAATLMGQLKSALRAYSYDGYSPSEVLSRLNDVLHEAPTGDQMATLIYCRFDASTGVLNVANAGHPPLLILAPDGTAHFLEDAVGMPLGAVPSGRYHETAAALAPGSVILLYTDGLVETRESTLDEGMERLRRQAETMADADVDTMCERLLAASSGGGEDDTALLALRWHALGDRVALRLLARPTVLRPLRALIRRWLRDGGTTEEDCEEILVAVSEAVTNVIRHAARGAMPTFDLVIERDPTLRVIVSDRGSWRPPSATRPGGNGFNIMRRFMDDVQVSATDEGTVVTLTRGATSTRAT